MKTNLRTALFAIAAVAVLFLAGAAPSFACYCYNGASCGVNLGAFPCGGSVCGNDYHMYKCVSGTWVYQSTTCSCAVAPEEEELAMVTPADAPLVEALYAQIMSVDPAQAQPLVSE